LTSEGVNVQGQIVSELASLSYGQWGKKSPESPALMVFRIVTGVVPKSLSELFLESLPKEMRPTTTLLPRLSPHESALNSMRMDRFFPWVEEKNPGSPWWVLLESVNLALARVYSFLPRVDEEPTSSMEHRRRRTGRRTGMAPLGCRITSLSWLGRRTTPRKMDGDVASFLENLPLESRAIPATETRLRRRRGMWKPKMGISRRRGRVFIQKVQRCKWYAD
jgi:hypothetical protein